MATEQMGREWVDVLAGVPLFSALSGRHVRRIAGLATTRRYRRYTMIVRQGDPGDAFYVILDGTVLVKRPGKRSVTLGVGDSFGELALLDGTPRTASVEAQQDVLTMRLSRPAFARMLEREPKVAIALLGTMAGRLRSSGSAQDP